MHKLILSALAVWHGFNGVFMLAMPVRWYETVPGVTHTGPFNGHFIADIAIAFLASATGLAIAAAVKGSTAAALLVAPSVFLGGHAILHLAEFTHGHLGFAGMLRDAAIIVVPGLLPAWFLFTNFRRSTQGES